MTLISKFPPIYTKSQLYGTGVANLFSAILQVLCLAIADGSTITAALIYFSCGTLVMFITLLLAFLTRYSDYYKFYLGDPEADTKKVTYTAKEIWETTKKTWSCQIISSVLLSLLIFGHANITCLVVSEYYEDGTVWSRK